MTWPFENDTSAIVKKLADRSMKADKRRNAFIIITIAFAVSLMMVLALYNLGTDRENRLYLQGRYQGSFINSTSTVFEKLEHNNQIEAVGKEAAMGTSRINDYTLDVYYRDQNALELKGVTDLLGKMPEAENEIIVEQSYLEHLGFRFNWIRPLHWICLLEKIRHIMFAALFKAEMRPVFIKSLYRMAYIAGMKKQTVTIFWFA